MKAIWKGEDDEFCLRYGKVYEILSIEWEGTMFNVVDETDDNYLYPADDFEIIEEYEGEKRMTGTQEKNSNSVIGAIVGDVVGSVYEFDNIKKKEFALFENHNGNKCFATDDSIMTLAVCKALCEYGGDESKLSEIAARQMHEIGVNYPGCGYGGRFGMWIFLEDSSPYNSYGNGAAMRVSPVAYAAKTIEEVKRLSALVTGVSHNHPEGMKGAEATAVCTWLALHGSKIPEIKNFVQEHYYPVDFTLDEIRDSYGFDETCQGTVPQALEAFFESTSFEDAIRNAISLGGDSDTLAAITGAVAAAYYGVPGEIAEKAKTYLDRRLYEIFTEFVSKF